MNPFELLEKPQMLHAIIVHGPIFLALAGVPLLILAMIFWRQAAWRWAALLFYGVATLSAWISEETGEAARALVPPTIPADAGALLSRHAALGERVWLVTLGVFVLIALSFVNHIRFRELMLLLATGCAVAAAAMVAGTAHMGGSLVYIYGIGTPHMHQTAAAPAPAPTKPVDAPAADPAPAPAPAAAAAPVDAVDPQSAPAAEAETAPAPAAETSMEPMATPAAEIPAETAAIPADAAASNGDILTPDTSADDPSWIKIRPVDMAEAEKVSYQDQVFPLLDDQCIWCHGKKDPDSDLDMSTVALMLKGGKKLGPALVPGKPDESNMIKYIRGIYQPRMPDDEPPLTEDQLHLLRMWIAAGAKEE